MFKGKKNFTGMKQFIPNKNYYAILIFMMKNLILLSLIVPVLANDIIKNESDVTEKILIFDIDHTLYPLSKEKAVKKVFTKSFIDYICDASGIQINNKFIAQLKKNMNSSSSYNALKTHFNISKEHFDMYFLSNNYTFDDIEYNGDLKMKLEALQFKGYKLFCLTNGYYLQAKKTLEALGIEDLFQLVITYDIFSESTFRKPNLQAFQCADYIFRNFTQLNFQDNQYITFEQAREICNTQNHFVKHNTNCIISFFDNECYNIDHNIMNALKWTGYHIRTDDCLMNFLGKFY